MKINTSQISMDASTDHREVSKRLGEVIRNQEGQEQPFRLKLPGMSDLRQERVAENRQSQEVCAASSVRCPGAETRYETRAEQVMERMVEEVVGQRTRVRRSDELSEQKESAPAEPLNPRGQQVSFSLLYQSLHYEYEKVSVHSAGNVALADGRKIDFSLQLSMERESLVRESVAWQGAGGILMDPLVFNFDCDLRGLADKSFQFDLDCDGKADELSSLKPGTGFLALDLNNDKKINNGRELFGPTTGHGFQELAVHDFDLNGWIDENDPIFFKLRIWKQGEVGAPVLLSLAEAGVGAICLTHDQNGFQLKNKENRLMGEVAATGVFLTEAGEVRPMQEIKLAMQAGEKNLLQGVREREDREPLLFLRQMIALRKAEVDALARMRLSRQEEQKEYNLMTTLFPDWRKERGLSSVELRRQNSFPG